MMVLSCLLAVMTWIGDGRPDLVGAQFYADDPAPEFRASFVSPSATGTTVRVACAGYFDLRVNGHLLGGRLAPKPLWSPYDHTVYVESYFVPAAWIKPAPAQNELSVSLGNGFYNLPPLKFWGSIEFRKHLAHGRPCFALEIVGSDEPLSWQWRETNLKQNCVYLGAVVDATAKPGAWAPAATVKGPAGKLVPRLAPAIVRRGEFAGKARWVKEGAVQVVDFGANRTGVPRFRFAKAPKGARIEVVYGERLNKDGSVNPRTQTAGQIKRAGLGGEGAPALAAQRDVYVSDGLGREFVPPFVWHVARYAEVRGYGSLLGSGEVSFVALASDVKDNPKAVSPKFAHPEYAKIHDICRRTFLANLMGVQSDCPGRERLGYGGDIAASCEALIANFDMKEFYLKTLQDFADEASVDGWITETAPFVGIADASGLASGEKARRGPISWAIVMPVLMDAILRHYPDAKARALAFYPTCLRYVKLMDERYPSGVVPVCIGDHEAIERAPNAVTATAHWHLFVSLTAKFARALGLAEDAAALDRLAGKVRKAFAERFVKPDGTVANGTQSAQAIALYLGLVPEALVKAADEKLVAAVEAKGGALSTGLFSTRYLLLYLSENEHQDIAERIVRRRAYPGWLHMVDRGATTLWETWKESDDVFSNCHPMLGSVDEWLLKYGQADAPKTPQCEEARGWKQNLAASDEFNGGALDRGKWDGWCRSFQGRSSTSASVAKSEDGFVFSPGNVAVEGGELTLAARRLNGHELRSPRNEFLCYAPYSTAIVRSRRKHVYGYYEIRAKTMKACVSNAFWLYDPHSDDPGVKFAPGDFSEEIDIFETTGRPDFRGKAADCSKTYYNTTHFYATPYLEGIVNRRRILASQGTKVKVDYDFCDAYHTYGFLWTPEKLVWYLDGKVTREERNEHFHRPLHVTFDCEVFAGWFGVPDPEDLPAKFCIDYFRLWECPPPRNAALVPRTKIEPDGYNWFERHEKILAYARQADPEIVFIGDSITHFWAGRDTIGGEFALPRWKKHFGKYRTLNLGYGWDRTGNVLWRLDHGEMDGVKPKLVVVHIGGNNYSKTKNYPGDTAEEVAEGVLAVVAKAHEKAPAAKVVVMGVFPFGEKPDAPHRVRALATNAMLAREVPKLGYATFLDLTSQQVGADGLYPKELARDHVHPTDKGYDLWAAALSPHLP